MSPREENTADESGDLCDDCGLPTEECECCPQGEHNPGDRHCECTLTEFKDDRGLTRKDMPG
jgi:hypothetical protein